MSPACEEFTLIFKPFLDWSYELLLIFLIGTLMTAELRFVAESALEVTLLSSKLTGWACLPEDGYILRLRLYGLVLFVELDLVPALCCPECFPFPLTSVRLDTSCSVFVVESFPMFGFEDCFLGLLSGPEDFPTFIVILRISWEAIAAIFEVDFTGAFKALFPFGTTLAERGAMLSGLKSDTWCRGAFDLV